MKPQETKPGEEDNYLERKSSALVAETRDSTPYVGYRHHHIMIFILSKIYHNLFDLKCTNRSTLTLR
jgi:hypothetical protein